MGIFVTIEVPLRCFTNSAVLDVALIRQGVSFDVLAVGQSVSEELEYHETRVVNGNGSGLT
jgi:hypothetical protein